MVDIETNHFIDVSVIADSMTEENASRLNLTKDFIQHGSISVYSHCFSVVYGKIKIQKKGSKSA